MSYQRCGICGNETLHDDTGRCGFCLPRGIENRPEECPLCGTEFDPSPRPGVAKQYCSRGCQQKAWNQTARGAAWMKEKRRRRNERQKYIRTLEGAA